MKGFKAFSKGLICKGKQYAENTVFEENEAEICKSGMHFCAKPLDVLDYYPLVDENGDITEFAEVESLDEVKTNDNKKYCTKKLKICAKIDFAKLVQADLDIELEKSPMKENTDSVNKDSAWIGSSGDSARIGSSGDYARIGSSGDSAQIGSSGDSAQIGSSGDSAQIGSSGYSARIGSSGYSARIGSSGGYAQIGSSGDSAQIESNGKHSVICCAGNNSVAKGKIGSWITLSEWKYDEKERANIPVCVKTEFIDGKRIKEDTFYRLKNGEFTEVN